MPAPIEFYFDFASPYAYLASHRIDEIAGRHGRGVAWKPFSLGVAFKRTGMAPLTEMPMRGAYGVHDMARSARALGVPFQLPEGFPMFALAPSRAFYWLADGGDDRAVGLARALFDAYFGEGRDVAAPETVAELAAPLGIDRDALLDAVGDPAVKARFRQATEEALDRGVFGAPFFFVDGEPFWGHDRLDQIDRWLATGGW